MAIDYLYALIYASKIEWTMCIADNLEINLSGLNGSISVDFDENEDFQPGPLDFDLNRVCLLLIINR